MHSPKSPLLSFIIIVRKIIFYNRMFKYLNLLYNGKLDKREHQDQVEHTRLILTDKSMPKKWKKIKMKKVRSEIPDIPSQLPKQPMASNLDIEASFKEKSLGKNDTDVRPVTPNKSRKKWGLKLRQNMPVDKIPSSPTPSHEESDVKHSSKEFSHKIPLVLRILFRLREAITTPIDRIGSNLGYRSPSPTYIHGREGSSPCMLPMDQTKSSLTCPTTVCRGYDFNALGGAKDSSSDRSSAKSPASPAGYNRSKLLNIDDYVPRDEYRVEEWLKGNVVGPLINSETFKRVTLLAIIVNTLIVALQTNESLARRYHVTFLTLDSLLVAFFIWEIGLKWYYGFEIFWNDAWNVFDFVVVLSMVVKPVVNEDPGSRLFLLLRVFKAVRILRIIGMIRGLKTIVGVILQSVPDIVSVIMLIIYLVLVLSICGVKLFAEQFPEDFGDLSKASFSVFTAVTQNGWLDLLHKFQVAGKTASTQAIVYYIVAKIYFAVAVILGGFVLTNLLVAVIITNLEVSIRENEKEESGRVLGIGDKGTEAGLLDNSGKEDLLGKGNKRNLLKIIPFAGVQSGQYADFWKNSKSLQTDPKFGKVDPELIKILEVSMNALEENKKEYYNIMRDFKHIQEVVKKLNIKKTFNQEEPAQYPITGLTSTTKMLSPLLSPMPSNTFIISGENPNISESARGGDILSNLMQMENRRLSKASNHLKIDDESIKSLATRGSLALSPSSNNLKLFKDFKEK